MASKRKLAIPGSVKNSRLAFELIINLDTSLVESKYVFYNEMSPNSAADDLSSNLLSVAFCNSFFSDQIHFVN